MKKWLFLVFAGLVFSEGAMALTTEIGVQYWRKQTSFDANNYLDSESITGSLSFYFFERVALEGSYTDAKAVREEKIYSGSTVIQQQTVVQVTNVVGADLIFMLTDRKTMFQPYLKGGVAQITRKQEVKVNNLNTYTLEPEKAIVPSYGAGLKIALTDTLGIKISYDAWQTPVGGGAVTNDAQLRAGVTWLL